LKDFMTSPCYAKNQHPELKCTFESLARIMDKPCDKGVKKSNPGKINFFEIKKTQCCGGSGQTPHERQAHGRAIDQVVGQGNQAGLGGVGCQFAHDALAHAGHEIKPGHDDTEGTK
jgi:hypothetical protein